jgi:TrmH family RNA methyltransferase
VDVEDAVALAEGELQAELVGERGGESAVVSTSATASGRSPRTTSAIAPSRSPPPSRMLYARIRTEAMITSPSNPRLRLLRRLHSRRQRERLGLFACEGEDLVEAGLDAGFVPVEALVDADRPALVERLPDAEPVAPALLGEVSALGHPPRVIAVFRRDELPRGTRDATLALWRVGDPGNVGTLLRAADAFGAGLALSPGCADPTAPKALRASAGAIFRVPLAYWEEGPRPWIALVSHGGTPLPELELAERMTFVLGAEREGLPADVVADCDAAATIPQAEAAESLNVAMAGTIALYELSRRDSARAR